MSLIRWVIVPSVASALLAVALALVCRRIWRHSRPLGIIVTAGVSVRLLAAMAFFWVSYLQLPFLSSLQLGGGFWRVALDAPYYHRVGLSAAEGSLASLPLEIPSPIYVKALALWMRVMGTSPFSAALLNIACYVGSCAVLVAATRGLPAGAGGLRRVMLLALSASPILLFVSTQALKDDFFVLFAVVLGVGIWWIERALASPQLASWRRLIPGVVAANIGLTGTAGMRGYYPIIAMACFVPTLLAAFLGRARVRWWLLLGGVALAAVTAGVVLTMRSEAGRSEIDGVPLLSEVASVADRFRRRFATSGGSSNVAAAVAVAQGGAERLRDLAVGVGTLFVPLSLLDRVAVVHVSTGRAMMALADVDTLFFDAMVLTVAWMTWRLSREHGPNRPFLVYAVSLALILALPMAYVVTNVGTLVRLRIMVLVSIAMVPLAFARLPHVLGAEPSGPVRSTDASPATRAPSADV